VKKQKNEQGKGKKDTANVRLSRDLVGQLNYIISVEGGSQDTFLDPLVRKAIVKKFKELTLIQQRKAQGS
jgi:hypothetical protein